MTPIEINGDYDTISLISSSSYSSSYSLLITLTQSNVPPLKNYSTFTTRKSVLILNKIIMSKEIYECDNLHSPQLVSCYVNNRYADCSRFYVFLVLIYIDHSFFRLFFHFQKEQIGIIINFTLDLSASSSDISPYISTNPLFSHLSSYRF